MILCRLTNHNSHFDEESLVMYILMGWGTFLESDPRGPMGVGQYDSLGEYCGPHTASSVFLIIILRLIYSKHPQSLLSWTIPSNGTECLED